MKHFFYVITLLGIFISCNDKEKSIEEISEEVLNLTIEKNMKFRHFSNLCDGNGGLSDIYVKSDVFILPINKELIDAVVKLKQLRKN